VLCQGFGERSERRHTLQRDGVANPARRPRSLPDALAPGAQRADGVACTQPRAAQKRIAQARAAGQAAR